MDINIFDDCDIALETEGIIARRRYISDSTVAVEMRIGPGGAVPEHSTPESVFFYILEGEGILTVGGETEKAPAGTVASCPSGVLKSVRNEGKGILRVLVVKMS